MSRIPQRPRRRPVVRVFFFNDPATTEIYTLSLHDALPISVVRTDRLGRSAPPRRSRPPQGRRHEHRHQRLRSEEHTSELQSQSNLVCRLLLEKKKKNKTHINVHTTL